MATDRLKFCSAYPVEDLFDQRDGHVLGHGHHKIDRQCLGNPEPHTDLAEQKDDTIPNQKSDTKKHFPPSCCFVSHMAR